MRLWMVIAVAVLLSAVCPMSPAGEFEIIAVDRGGTIRWEALEGHAYTVESRDDPTALWEAAPPAEQWPISVPEWLPNGGAGWPATARRFYRVRAEATSGPPAGMVLIPGGTNSGTDPDFGEYSLTVDSFYMDRYGVAKALWDEVRDWSGGNGYSYDNAGSGKAADHPVQTVNWYDVVKWCNARSEKEGRTPAYYADAGLAQVYKTGRVEPYLKPSANGYRLPTDAEREYAARGGAAGRRFPWSESDNIQHARANYYSSGSQSYDTSPTRGHHPVYAATGTPYTSPVGSFAANGYGLHDMAGNVWEWCYDRHPELAGSYRVFRGGSWYLDAHDCRVALRLHGYPDRAFHFLGFRTAVTPSQP